MQIREARPSDILFLKRLLVQLGYPEQDESDIQHQLDRHRQEGYQLLVAEIDMEVVAFIALHWFSVFHKKGTLGRISAFCVDEHFRGQGIGIQLLEAAEAFFRIEGCTRIEVTSNNRRINAHEFYLKRGYRGDSKRFTKEL